jgi:hypothetical protein
MANITLTFTEIPDSLTVGDVAWYLDVSSGNEIEMGPVTSIGSSSLIINAAAGVVPPSVGDFVFYIHNPIGYLGQLKGYFAEVNFRNNTLEYAELFSIGSEVFESSK